MIGKIKLLLHKYKRWEAGIFFVAGFSFDALLLHRIDDPLMLVHQAIYLSLSAFIIGWDLVKEQQLGSVAARNWPLKAWTYREGFLHFLLGTLLNVYTIFYFKSGTIFSSLVFLTILACLLLVNEVRPPQLSKHLLRNSLFGLCIVSYMNIVVPIAFGEIGPLVFACSILAAIFVQGLFILFLQTKLEARKVWREIFFPFLSVVLIYVFLYALKILPPVPLSIKFMGVYRDVSKVGDQYQLTYSRPSWKFWQHGDQVFYARPGDKIYCFVQVFSPARFKGLLSIRWQFYQPNVGWKNADSIPINLVGGRAEGYRGYTVKNNYQAGEWRVLVESNDGREVGRMYVDIEDAGEDSVTEQLKYDFR